MKRLREHIETIGAEVVTCPGPCRDVVCDPKNGIPPRCLYLEIGEGRGSVIVGLNPGRADINERSFFKHYGTSYQVVERHWLENRKATNRYYTRLRSLVRILNLPGPIWWTELAKCQSKGNKQLSTQTLRYCGKMFLHRELECLPKDWVIIAVGRKSYYSVAYLLPDRTMIGVPHPTGSFGHWPIRKGRISANLAAAADKAINSVEPLAVWLTNAIS